MGSSFGSVSRGDGRRADDHRRELPPELIEAAAGEFDPDRRILKLLGARKVANLRHSDGCWEIKERWDFDDQGLRCDCLAEADVDLESHPGVRHARDDRAANTDILNFLFATSSARKSLKKVLCRQARLLVETALAGHGAIGGQSCCPSVGLRQLGSFAPSPAQKRSFPWPSYCASSDWNPGGTTPGHEHLIGADDLPKEVRLVAAVRVFFRSAGSRDAHQPYGGMCQWVYQ